MCCGDSSKKKPVLSKAEEKTMAVERLKRIERSQRSPQIPRYPPIPKLIAQESNDAS